MVRYPDYIRVYRAHDSTTGSAVFEQSSPKYDPFSEDSIGFGLIYEGDCKVVAKERSGIYERGDYKVIIPDPNVPNLEERDVCELTINGGIDGNDSETKSLIQTIVVSYIHYEYNSIVYLVHKKDGNEYE